MNKHLIVKWVFIITIAIITYLVLGACVSFISAM